MWIFQLIQGCSSSPIQETGDYPQHLLKAHDQALAFMKSGQDNLARDLLAEIYRQAPDSIGAAINLTLVEMKLDHLDAARKVLEELAVRQPERADIVNLQGVVERKSGHFDKAEHYFIHATELDPELPDPVLNLGILFDLYLGNKRKALDYYERYQELKILRDGEKDPAAALWIADLKRKSKNVQEIQKNAP